MQPGERKSKYFLHCLWQGGVENILQHKSARKAVPAQTESPSGPAICILPWPQADT